MYPTTPLMASALWLILGISQTWAQESQLIAESNPVRFDWSQAGAVRTLMPQFASGMLILPHRAGLSDPQFSLYSRDAKLVARVRVDIPEAGRTAVNGITPLRNGFAVSAMAISGSERVGVLCLLDTPGKLRKIVKTDPFTPDLIALAPDGTIWTFGAVDHENDPASAANVLYHFTEAGELLGSALPRNLFGKEPPDYLSTELGRPALTSAGNRVVFYSPHTRQLFELALDGRVIGSYVIPLPNQLIKGKAATKPMTMMALALTEAGAIYGDLRGGENSGIYELDRARQSWVPTSTDVMQRVSSYVLLGSDGEDLVLGPTGPRNTDIEVHRIRLRSSFVQ